MTNENKTILNFISVALLDNLRVLAVFAIITHYNALRHFYTFI